MSRSWLVLGFVIGFCRPLAAVAPGVCTTDLTTLRHQVQTNPANEISWIDFGRCATLLNQWAVVRDVTKTALEKNPNLSRPRALLALSFLQEKNYSQAVTEFLKASQSDPTYPLPYYYLAGCYMALQKPEASLSAAQKAVQLGPLRPENHRVLANIQLSLHRTDAAITSAKHAVGLAPKDAEGYVVLGKAYVQGNQLKRAAAAFHTALSIEPQNTEAAENLKSLPAASSSVSKK